MANTDRVLVRGDCGHVYEVALAGRDPREVVLRCPDCGYVDGFTDEQAAEIMGIREGEAA